MIVVSPGSSPGQCDWSLRKPYGHHGTFPTYAWPEFIVSLPSFIILDETLVILEESLMDSWWCLWPWYFLLHSFVDHSKTSVVPAKAAEKSYLYIYPWWSLMLQQGPPITLYPWHHPWECGLGMKAKLHIDGRHQGLSMMDSPVPFWVGSKKSLNLILYHPWPTPLILWLTLISKDFQNILCLG